MSGQEYRDIVRLLRGSFRQMFQTNEQTEVWWTWLKEYDFHDAKNGVTSYIMNETREPTIAAIIDWIDKARERERIQMRNAQIPNNSKTVRCIHCKDTGLIVTTTPTGVQVGRACRECEMGRTRYPWEFLTDEEKEEWFQKEEKKGRRPCRHPHEAPEDFYMEYCYGVNK